MTTTTRTTRKPKSEPIDEQQQFVTTICTWLNETRDEPRAQIAIVVRTIGAAKTMELLKEVLAIENAGGLQVLNKTKRRSVGGVFFHLVKQRYGKELPPAFWTLTTNGGKKATKAKPAKVVQQGKRTGTAKVAQQGKKKAS